MEFIFSRQFIRRWIGPRLLIDAGLETKLFLYCEISKTGRKNEINFSFCQISLHTSYASSIRERAGEIVTTITEA